MGSSSVEVEGMVVLMKKSVLLKDPMATAAAAAVLSNYVHEPLEEGVSLQLVSTVTAEQPLDPPTTAAVQGLYGKLGRPTYLKRFGKEVTLTPENFVYKVTFHWDETIGTPEAFVIRNHLQNEFYLKTVTVKDIPGGVRRVHFVCNSWVYPVDKYDKDRVFFANKAYLPHQTPPLLVKYREEELVTLRGDGTGELQEWDRVYDYAYYNDLGSPDEDPNLARPILGGSTEYPYPRRGRTGRPPTDADPNTERRLSPMDSLKIYVPRDERFDHLKMSDFLAYAVISLGQFVRPALHSSFYGEFNSFADVLEIYKGGIELPHFLEKLQQNIPSEILNLILKIDWIEGKFRYPKPQVIQVDTSAWRTDEEFGREMLAGVNPLVISRLEEFPPTSKLDPEVYGCQNSSITKEHIEGGLNGFTVEEAIEKNRLFILDHHDAIMIYLRRINMTSTKTYATRTILFLEDDSTLKPLAIELSLPHQGEDKFGCINKVYTPSKEGVEGSIWELAKAYVAVNDSGYHQLISHWLNTHATIEPFVIATNRQLSVLHPIYKLLHPHFRDTMNINAFARQVLINAGGILEDIVFPAQYAMEMSSAVYKNWIFLEQALPADLIKRGMAVEDNESPRGIRLVIDDYPYAVDGLEIWAAIKTWVEDYCSVYYPDNEVVQKDTELQSWWKELVEVGHGDKKDEPWWPKMQSLKELTETCTIIIWVASALHAAVNFGQYDYAGYFPNRPTMSLRFMPEKGTPEYEEAALNPETAFLGTITSAVEALLGISLIEILSTHSSDEVYLGETDASEWTKDVEPLEAFKRFGKKLREIEERILRMNGDKRWKNRRVSVEVAYTLLYPSSEHGITGKGIPNSIST